MFSLLFLTTLRRRRVDHPIVLARGLVVRAFLRAILVGSLELRWLFYLLTLVFLGGVMVVLLFMVSVCANEKIFFSRVRGGSLGLVSLGGLSLRWQLVNFNKGYSGFQLGGLVYESEQLLGLLILVLILILCIIRVVRIAKVDLGPLVKRL